MVVDRDDVELVESCRVVVPPGLVIADANGDGVIHVRTPGIHVAFAPGSVLRGADPATPWDRLSGYGVRVEQASGVTLAGLRVHGYRCAVWATGADGITVAESDLSDNFRQRLGSTPWAEDQADWLWPHENDANQWLARYGAAVWLEELSRATVREVRVRRGQNGIVLDSVSDSRIFDNDCSFLSGWGLALWRSSDNVVSRNAFDFCVRGYSHGVYNRGQDSAGILCFEQCNRNLFAENSATHGGDGLFAFAGKEALGEVGGHAPDWYRRRGNNDNFLIGNDFSYAAAHGVEITFSFGNKLTGNRIVGNAICGLWGGYSQDTVVFANQFEHNGQAGYGLERGGVNIEHGRRNRVLSNGFAENACGVHLWWDEDEALARLPWALANGTASEDNEVSINRFVEDGVAIQLRGPSTTRVLGNQFDSVGEELRQEAPAEVERDPGRRPDDLDLAAVLPEAVRTVSGRTQPVGARAELRGRKHIVMTEWGPWDHESPLLRRVASEPGLHRFELLPRGTASVISAPSEERWSLAVDPEDGALTVTSDSSGVVPYRLQLRAGGVPLEAAGLLVDARWQVRFFAWTHDPREEPTAWQDRLASVTAAATPAILSRLDLPFAHGGPSDLGIEGIPEDLPADRFGCVAETRLRFPAGRYRLATVSDDGVRVWFDGELVIDNWTWHPPTRDEAVIAVEQDREVPIRIEHFELDGYAQLLFEIAVAD